MNLGDVTGWALGLVGGAAGYLLLSSLFGAWWKLRVLRLLREIRDSLRWKR